MKFTLSFIVFFICYGFAQAQDLTGVWRGNFYSGSGFYKQQYKYEVQLSQSANKALKGVTYSYRTTVFYGKAALQGIFMDKNKSIIIKETKMLEMKITDQSTPCLMTCYLDYYKLGKKEVLEGTFTSLNTNDGSDCGAGNVYLEKELESDFHKEDFLLNKKSPVIPTPNKALVKLKPKPDDKVKRLQTLLGTTPDGIAGPKTNMLLTSKLPSFKGKITPGNADSLIAAINKTKTNQTAKTAPPFVKKSIKANPQIAKNQQKKDSAIITNTDTKVFKLPTPPQVINKNIPIPQIIKERENPVLKTISTSNPDIRIQLFDNGDIDGDIITVYHNNEIIAYKKTLTAQPITININADANNTHHEFIMVAENLGTIPPNTALMVITTGGRRYELSISSDEKKNAKVIIDYKMPGE